MTERDKFIKSVQRERMEGTDTHHPPDPLSSNQKVDHAANLRDWATFDSVEHVKDDLLAAADEIERITEDRNECSRQTREALSRLDPVLDALRLLERAVTACLGANDNYSDVMEAEKQRADALRLARAILTRPADETTAEPRS